MIDLVAKRYVKAILKGLNHNEFELFYKDLDKISTAYANEKFRDIIISPVIKNSQKTELVLSFIDENNPKFINFIKVLGEKNRLAILPNIVEYLFVQRAKNENTYHGKIRTNKDLTQEEIKQIEQKFEKKFNAKIIFCLQKDDYDGIKVELDELGVEASFSSDRLKAQMSEYILKAI